MQSSLALGICAKNYGALERVPSRGMKHLNFTGLNENYLLKLPFTKELSSMDTCVCHSTTQSVIAPRPSYWPLMNVEHIISPTWHAA
jgi:hypothetical protein